MGRLRRRVWMRPDESGSVPIEGLFGGLLLLTWFMLAYQIYDAFRTRAIVGTASFTVADLISRQRNAIGPEFVTGTKRIFDQMTRVQDASRSSLRVTLIACPATQTDLRPCDGSTKAFRLEASHAAAGGQALDDAGLARRTAHIPMMAAGDSAVIVETSYNYRPLFGIGDRQLTLDGRTSTVNGLSSRLRFHDLVVTRPRGPRIVWSDDR